MSMMLASRLIRLMTHTTVSQSQTHSPNCKKSDKTPGASWPLVAIAATTKGSTG